LAQGSVFEISEVKQLVFYNSAANRRAQTVKVIAGIGPVSIKNIGIVYSIQISVLQVFVNRAVELIGPALDDYIEDAARVAAKLTAELILKNRKLGNRFI
jgi:hypothetical protein